MAFFSCQNQNLNIINKSIAGIKKEPRISEKWGINRNRDLVKQIFGVEIGERSRLHAKNFISPNFRSTHYEFTPWALAGVYEVICFIL